MSKEDKSFLDQITKGSVIGVKGSTEDKYRVGNVNITAANIGLGNVNNTADSAKSVNYANSAGTCTGNAATATKANQLTTARTIQTNLASTSTASFNGTANVTPGVTGTLPVANGGTGQTNLSNVTVGMANYLSVVTISANINIDELSNPGIYYLNGMRYINDSLASTSYGSSTFYLAHLGKAELLMRGDGDPSMLCFRVKNGFTWSGWRRPYDLSNSTRAVTFT